MSTLHLFHLLIVNYSQLMLTYLQKNPLKWRKEVVEKMMKHVRSQEATWDLNKFHSNDKAKDEKDKSEYIRFLRKTTHDPVRYGGGLSLGMTTFYKLLEFLPNSRWVEKPNRRHIDGRDGWKSIWFPPNCGAPRSIPSNSIAHSSVMTLQKCKTEECGFLDLLYDPEDPSNNSLLGRIKNRWKEH